MRPTPSLENLKEDLEISFGVRYRTSDGVVPKARMIGLLFAPYDLKITKDELLPSYHRYNIRSGKNIDFFWAGYSETDPDPAATDAELVKDSKYVLWYSDQCFETFRQQIAARTSWQYGGGVELLLLNASYIEFAKEPIFLDFATTVRTDLGKSVKNGVIDDVSSFFESLFLHTEKQSGDDPTWGFSSEAGAKAGKSALIDVVLSALPFKADPIRDLGSYLMPVGAA